MIRVFNGDALAIQENDYDWRTALHYFLDGHHNDYVLVYRDDKPIKALSYHDVCYNRDVPEKVTWIKTFLQKQGNIFLLMKRKKNVGSGQLQYVTELVRQSVSCIINIIQFE